MNTELKNLSRHIFTNKRPFYHFTAEELKGGLTLAACFSLPFVVWSFQNGGF